MLILFTLNGKAMCLDSHYLMLGCYGPKKELHSYTTPPEQAPSGMLARGDYHVTSVLMDDDLNMFCSWSWNMKIAKDWHVTDSK